MKKFLLLLVAMLLTSAASFADRVLLRPAPQPIQTEGTEQYLYNVEYGGFLVGANEYGKRVSVSREGGQKFSIEVDEDGNFKIGAISPDDTDGIWLDGARPGNDKFQLITLGDNLFQITNTKFPDTFLTWSGDESDTRVYFTETPFYGGWYSVSDEAYEEYMHHDGPEKAKCYFAALPLKDLLDQADELEIDGSSERAVYYNEDATIEQIQDAIASLTAKINEAKIKQYTLTYDNATKFLKLTKKGCSSYEATNAGGASLEGYEGVFAFAPADPEWTFSGNTCIAAFIDLSAGDYTLKVQAGTYLFDGAENEAFEISFTVEGSTKLDVTLMTEEGTEYALNENSPVSIDQAISAIKVAGLNQEKEYNYKFSEGSTTLVEGLLSVNTIGYAEYAPLSLYEGHTYTLTLTSGSETLATYTLTGAMEEEGSDLDFTNKVVKNVKACTSTIEEGKWYTWSNPRTSNANYGAPTPFYDQGEGKKPKREVLGQTVRTVLSENAPIADVAKYLVRFTKSGTGEAYHIQFATGNYLKSNLTTSATASEAGLFMVYGATNTKSAQAGAPYTSAGVGINITNDGTTYGERLDGNGAGSEILTWGAGKITSDANNVWFIEEVEMGEATTETYTVHIMGAPAPTKVTYNGTQYGNNDTFEATGFTVSALTVPDHENYVKDVYVNGTDIYVSYTYAKKVAALTELSNDKAYMVMCERGQLTTNEGQLAPTGKKSYTDGKSTFAFVKYEDNYYLWSTAENGFVFNDKTIATEGEFQTVGFTPQADGTFVLSLGGAEGYLNMQNGGNGLIIDNYSTPDPGNKYNLYEVEIFDPTAALALLTPATGGFEGVVTSALDDEVVTSYEKFNGIELTFEGATKIEAFDELGIYADLWLGAYEEFYLCDENYNDGEEVNCSVKVEGNKLTLDGFVDAFLFYSTNKQRLLAKRGAQWDETKKQWTLLLSNLKIDGKAYEEIPLYFDAEGNATVKFAPTAVSPEEGTVEGELETVTLTFDKAVSAAEGKVAVVSAMDVEKEKIAEVVPTVSEDGMTATFALNLTEANIYFLALPEGLFTTEDGEVSEAKEYTWTLTEAEEAEPVDLDKVFIKSQAGEYFGIASGQVAVVKEPFAWTFAERTGEGNENAYQLCDYDETYWINTGSNGYLSTAKIAQTNNIRNYYFYEATTTETTVTGKLVEAPMKGNDYMIVVKNINASPNNGLYAIYCSLAKDKTDRFDVVKISNDETVIPAQFTLTTESESSNGAIDFQKVVWNLINENTTGIATAATTATTDAIFSITGQRIMKLQKGINIVGGKKVIR